VSADDGLLAAVNASAEFDGRFGFGRCRLLEGTAGEEGEAESGRGKEVTESHRGPCWRMMFNMDHVTGMKRNGRGPRGVSRDAG
jgi:hypothetical protein